MGPIAAGIFSLLIAAASAETATNANGVRIDRLIPSGQMVTQNILKCLIEVPVKYCDPNGKCDRTGILIVNKELKTDVTEAFAYMREIKFPITMMIPSHHFTIYPPSPSGDRRPGWDDEQIMSEDNTSSYNPRYIFGTDHASLHAFGEAIDINPRCNPAIHKSGLVEPANGRRKDPATADPDCSMDSDKGKLVVKKFKSLGWNWGGDWTDPRDSQHFQKPGPNGNRVYIWNAQGLRVQAPHCN
jgi:hypothetical protein